MLAKDGMSYAESIVLLPGDTAAVNRYPYGLNAAFNSESMAMKFS